MNARSGCPALSGAQQLLLMPCYCQPQDALAPPGSSDDPAADPLADALTPQGSRCGRNVQREGDAIMQFASSAQLRGTTLAVLWFPRLILCYSLRLGGNLCSRCCFSNASMLFACPSLQAAARAHQRLPGASGPGSTRCCVGCCCAPDWRLWSIGGDPAAAPGAGSRPSGG